MKDERDEGNEPDEDRELLGRLAELPAEIEPPPSLEERTVRALRHSGILRRGRPRRRLPGRAFRLAAAALLLLALGFSAGRLDRGAPRAGLRYLLLLREDRRFRVPDAGSRVLVEEYSRWAAGLRRDGSLVAGERLAAESKLLPAGESPLSEARIGGLFIVVAGSDAEALALARTCPHLAHGGSLELRKIVPTGRR
ncbi:MAG TPA: hypothetical protein VHR45_16905 [Thermoanaerobaculia bacterium]|nr:hypothetical protein [Thermoanaerobaculia bacterium]